MIKVSPAHRVHILDGDATGGGLKVHRREDLILSNAIDLRPWIRENGSAGKKSTTCYDQSVPLSGQLLSFASSGHPLCELRANDEFSAAE